MHACVQTLKPNYAKAATNLKAHDASIVIAKVRMCVPSGQCAAACVQSATELCMHACAQMWSHACTTACMRSSSYGIIRSNLCHHVHACLHGHMCT